MKHIQAWLFWVICFFLIRLPLMILGFVIFPIAYVTRKKDDSLWLLFWLWDNKEDGIYGAKWFHKGTRDFKTAYKWSVIRNPVNNMRFTFLGLDRDNMEDFEWEYFGQYPIPTPRLARDRGGVMWHYSVVWNGWLWFPSFWYIRSKSNIKHFRVRLGWKCTYKWILNNELSATGKFSGITFQFLPNRDG